MSSSPDPDPDPRRGLVALAHVSAFVAASALWVALLATGVALAMQAAGRTVVDAADLEPAVLGAVALLQSLGLASLAVVLSRWLPRADGPPFSLGDLRWGLAALPVGAVVWIAPSWLAALLSERWASALDTVAAGLSSDDRVGRAVLAAAVALGAPIFEEVVFRGYLWRALTPVGGATTAWLATTALFCAYHLDPVQSVALVPTALVLGWLRWRSGGLLAPMAAHFVNNALGVALAGIDVDLPFAAAAAGAAATGGLLVAAELTLRRR